MKANSEHMAAVSKLLVVSFGFSRSFSNFVFVGTSNSLTKRGNNGSTTVQLKQLSHCT